MSERWNILKRKLVQSYGAHLGNKRAPYTARQELNFICNLDYFFGMIPCLKPLRIQARAFIMKLVVDKRHQEKFFSEYFGVRLPISFLKWFIRFFILRATLNRKTNEA
jgi:hypothetical protein